MAILKHNPISRVARIMYQGSCHCGKIAFEVEGEIEQLTECNCSICVKRGYLFWFVAREQLRFTLPKTDLATYSFGDGTIKHHFCPNCGCAPLASVPTRQVRPWRPSTRAAWTTSSFPPSRSYRSMGAASKSIPLPPPDIFSNTQE